MTGFACRQRDVHGRLIAHLADDDHVGRLTERRAQGSGEVRRVDADFDLLHQAARVLVLVLDRIFDRDDVALVAKVDFVDERSQRGGLAGAGRPADEDEPAGQARERFDGRGKTERGEPRDEQRQPSNCRRGAPALPVQVHPKRLPSAPRSDRVRDAGVAELPTRVRSQGGQERFGDVVPVENGLRPGERYDRRCGETVARLRSAAGRWRPCPTAAASQEASRVR